MSKEFQFSSPSYSSPFSTFSAQKDDLRKKDASYFAPPRLDLSPSFSSILNSPFSSFNNGNSKPTQKSSLNLNATPRTSNNVDPQRSRHSELSLTLPSISSPLKEKFFSSSYKTLIDTQNGTNEKPSFHSQEYLDYLSQRDEDDDRKKKQQVLDQGRNSLVKTSLDINPNLIYSKPKLYSRGTEIPSVIDNMFGKRIHDTKDSEFLNEAIKQGLKAPSIDMVFDRTSQEVFLVKQTLNERQVQTQTPEFEIDTGTQTDPVEPESYISNFEAENLPQRRVVKIRDKGTLTIVEETLTTSEEDDLSVEVISTPYTEGFHKDNDDWVNRRFEYVPNLPMRVATESLQKPKQKKHKKKNFDQAINSKTANSDQKNKKKDRKNKQVKNSSDPVQKLEQKKTDFPHEALFDTHIQEKPTAVDEDIVRRNDKRIEIIHEVYENGETVKKIDEINEHPVSHPNLARQPHAENIVENQSVDHKELEIIQQMSSSGKVSSGTQSSPVRTNSLTDSSGEDSSGVDYTSTDSESLTEYQGTPHFEQKIEDIIETKPKSNFEKLKEKTLKIVEAKTIQHVQSNEEKEISKQDSEGTLSTSSSTIDEDSQDHPETSHTSPRISREENEFKTDHLNTDVLSTELDDTIREQIEMNLAFFDDSNASSEAKQESVSKDSLTATNSQEPVDRESFIRTETEKPINQQRLTESQTLTGHSGKESKDQLPSNVIRVNWNEENEKLTSSDINIIDATTESSNEQHHSHDGPYPNQTLAHVSMSHFGNQELSDEVEMKHISNENGRGQTETFSTQEGKEDIREGESYVSTEERLEGLEPKLDDQPSNSVEEHTGLLHNVKDVEEQSKEQTMNGNRITAFKNRKENMINENLDPFKLNPKEDYESSKVALSSSSDNGSDSASEPSYGEESTVGDDEIMENNCSERPKDVVQIFSQALISDDSEDETTFEKMLNNNLEMPVYESPTLSKECITTTESPISTRLKSLNQEKKKKHKLGFNQKKDTLKEFESPKKWSKLIKNEVEEEFKSNDKKNQLFPPPEFSNLIITHPKLKNSDNQLQEKFKGSKLELYCKDTPIANELPASGTINSPKISVIGIDSEIKDSLQDKEHKKEEKPSEATFEDVCPEEKEPSIIRGDISLGKGQYSGDLNRSGQPNGKGFYKGSDLTYDGSWLSGKKSGYGRIEYPDGSVYTGELLDDNRHGQGFYFTPNYTHVGHWEEDKKKGQGVIEYSSVGDKFEGNFVNNFPDGKGTYSFRDGSVYCGEFEKGCRNGEGILTYGDGVTKYDGEWVKDKQTGKAIITYLEGVYEGEVVNGKRNGQGTFTYANGDIYDGEWGNDLKQGKGIYFFEGLSSGVKYRGEWYKGRKHGQGILETRNHTEKRPATPNTKTLSVTYDEVWSEGKLLSSKKANM